MILKKLQKKLDNARARRPQWSCTQPKEPVSFWREKHIMRNAFKDLQQSLLLVSGRLGVLCNHDLVDDQEQHSLKGSGDLGLVDGCRDDDQHRELLKNLITFHIKVCFFIP